VTLLECINGPEDLKQLNQDQLTCLAGEIRDVLVETVTRTGGHLGPNLGVVELTIAVHRVFDSPRDKIVWDTGHQAYVHKLLTGRFAQFGTLRQRGGLTGYPSRAESEHDLVENSHASTSLSYADGLAKAYKLRGEPDRTVVAVIGDGALTGGMAWEALNNIAAAKDSRLVMIVNDNGWSYQPTIGGLAEHLAAIRVNPRYEHVLDYIKTTLPRTRSTACTSSPRPAPSRGRGAGCSAMSCWPSARGGPTWSRSPRRCCTRLAWPTSRTPTRTGPMTWASPSSTRSPALRAWPWAACTRWWPFTRRS